MSHHFLPGGNQPLGRPTATSGRGLAWLIIFGEWHVATSGLHGGQAGSHGFENTIGHSCAHVATCRMWTARWMLLPLFRHHSILIMFKLTSNQHQPDMVELRYMNEYQDLYIYNQLSIKKQEMPPFLWPSVLNGATPPRSGPPWMPWPRAIAWHRRIPSWAVRSALAPRRGASVNGDLFVFHRKEKVNGFKCCFVLKRHVFLKLNDVQDVGWVWFHQHAQVIFDIALNVEVTSLYFFWLTTNRHHQI